MGWRLIPQFYLLLLQSVYMFWRRWKERLTLPLLADVFASLKIRAYLKPFLWTEWVLFFRQTNLSCSLWKNIFTGSDKSNFINALESSKIFWNSYFLFKLYFVWNKMDIVIYVYKFISITFLFLPLLATVGTDISLVLLIS